MKVLRFVATCLLGVLAAPFYFVGLIAVGPAIFGARRFLGLPGTPEVRS